ncbi:HlyD family type I secretion periplasmic adaptor subunit [Ideonella sp. TBM-1]|uniref:Membrane fusion protein (MFP) family protein n=2 Tax=Ideonella livida TaxID=2707176 RepID=A0A7C9PK34_9BURK|nr:HlyD family type I secretion periplasmic adaptor subunit [Ideonella livida]
MIATLGAFLVVMIAWSVVAQLDVAVRARGQVTPPSKVQEVQSLEGGIVQALLVSAGQKVARGQTLVRLDTAQYTATAGESRQQQLAALAGLARTEALLGGHAPRFAPELLAEAPALVQKETQLWRDALAEYESALAVAREGVQRRLGELRETQSRIAALQSALRVSEEAFTIEERLYREGAGSRSDFLAAQQRLLTQRGELDTAQKSVPRMDAGLAEAQANQREVASRLRTQWGAQHSEYQTKVAALGSTLSGQLDRVERREITSPVDGVVNRVLVPTLGGVAAPGKAILEIVPQEADLTVIVRVKPADIGFIHVDQAAHVSVLAYDPATYGRLTARVSRVGADALLDEKNGEPYFEVELTAAPGQLKAKDRVLAITPGMPVEAGILTGSRSVMQYLLKPVLKGVQGALQER